MQMEHPEPGTTHLNYTVGFPWESDFPQNFSLGAIKSSDSHITGLDVSCAHSKFCNGDEWADVECRATLNQYSCHYHFLAHHLTVPYYA